MNQNLNSIIGGRSSGKSILLGAIAKKIGTEKLIKKDNVNYNSYIESNIVQEMRVVWCDGIDDGPRKIEYFPQSYINNLAADSKEITGLIETIICADTSKKALLDEYGASTIGFRTAINNLVSEYSQSQLAISKSTEELLVLGSRDGIGKQLSKLEEDLVRIGSKMDKSLTESEEEFYYRQNYLLEENRKRVIANDSEVVLLPTLERLITFPDISAKLPAISNLSRQSLLSHYEALTMDFQTKWGDFVHQLIGEKSSETQEVKEKDRDHCL